MSLTQSLERLVDIFEHRGIPMRQHLRPGLTRVAVQAALSPLGLAPPEELYELYEWHDGIDVLNTPRRLFADHQFLPLDVAVQEYHDLLKYNSEIVTSIDLAQCFPFAFFEGDYCTIYCDPTLVEGLQYPVINIFGGIAVAYEDIDRMAQTVAQWYVSGIYDSYPIIDENLCSIIWKRLNPHIPYRATSL